MDAWGVDVALAASQKGLMMPPGLGLVWAGPKALAAHRTADMRTQYWDWTYRTEDGPHYLRFCGTPPVAHLFGFREVLRMIDEEGMAAPLKRFLAEVKAANGTLHVSLDVDFLDPSIAPAVGTTVPGGATFREAHLVMEILCDSGLVGSLDLVELNPFLDERGRTAILMADLAASLLGKHVMDRPTRSY